MIKALTIIRRIFLAGSLSLLAIFILRIVGVNAPQFARWTLFGKVYSFFALFSPVLWLIFWLVSTAYIRKNGQFAEAHQEKKFGASMVECLVRDLTAPFRLIGEQFVTRSKLRNYYIPVAGDPQVADLLARGSKALNREKLLRMILRFAIYVLGVLAAINYIS